MTSYEPRLTDLDPYLNPQYWDGHSLGVGEVNSSHRSVGNVNEQEYRFAQNVVDGLRNRDFVVTETFNDGDGFEVYGHEPGSLVLIRNEMLKGEPIDEPSRFIDIAKLPLPERPTDMIARPGDRGVDIFASEGSTYYMSAIHYGVVLPGAVDAICLIDAMPHPRRQEMSMRVISPISVGETLHEDLKGGGEAISRINVIQAIDQRVSIRRRTRRLVAGLSLEGVAQP